MCGTACQRLTCQVTESSALREIDLIARIIRSQWALPGDKERSARHCARREGLSTGAGPAGRD